MFDTHFNSHKRFDCPTASFFNNKTMRILFRVQSRSRWSLVIGTVLLIGVLRLLHVNHTDGRRNTSPSAIPPQSQSAVDVFKCSRNDTMNISSSIPPTHRNFLMYKHCRTFSRLLSPTPCQNDLFLLLAVKSTAIQVDRRSALRNTWGKKGYVQGKKVKLLFLVGKSSDTIQGYPLQQVLEWESRQFGDILQWDFDDSFFNLTLKEIHFLKWFRLECRWAHYVFKGDDDVFVHTSNLVEYVKDNKPSEQLYAGNIMSGYPVRDKQSKYFIPVEMYPNKPYPLYAGGGGYLMSNQTVLSLEVAASSIDLFPIDDVFVGLCLQMMNITLTHHSGFKTFGLKQGVTHFNPCIYRELMVVHKLNPTEMWTMWSLQQDPKLQCFRSRT
uniref:N-acetyllactosaminide beta-1,3-N-acetylglucosaminyltransferase 4-like n=1 Tax=Oncorhynchus gorbuscha TaxID=8017 RepID=UPI001EAF873B|nr:N-acetyllactosaminide beta-1,3-N-acetylglucosaminyltransferase 4-like [Oncorhynchus gorbuscha]